MTDQDFEALFLRTVDPECKFDGRLAPAGTTLLYRVCNNDPKRFHEAVRIIRLFVDAADCEIGKR